MNKKRTIGIVLVLSAVVLVGAFACPFVRGTAWLRIADTQNQSQDEGGPDMSPHPLSIDALRQREYPGSDITIEQTLTPGSNYQRYVASYKSEGLKIYALLTVPNGDPPAGGWPAIIFNHGYIAPSLYKTTEKYVAYQDAFARDGYVTFKSDYRGHGNSEGVAQGGYGSNDYTIDVLSALASVKRYKNVNPNALGMWGHSMGGHITLNAMVVSHDIKAGVIWAGVVGSYTDLVERWHRHAPPALPGDAASPRGRWRQELSAQYGSPEENPDFWNSLSATSYLSDISGPLQLQHGTADTSVPLEFSVDLYNQLKALGKDAELYTYEGDDHNLSHNLQTALNRSVAFFDAHLKEGK